MRFSIYLPTTCPSANLVHHIIVTNLLLPSVAKLTLHLNRCQNHLVSLLLLVNLSHWKPFYHFHVIVSRVQHASCGNLTCLIPKHKLPARVNLSSLKHFFPFFYLFLSLLLFFIFWFPYDHFVIILTYFGNNDQFNLTGSFFVQANQIFIRNLIG